MLRSHEEKKRASNSQIETTIEWVEFIRLVPKNTASRLWPEFGASRLSGESRSAGEIGCLFRLRPIGMVMVDERLAQTDVAKSGSYQLNRNVMERDCDKGRL